MSKENNFKVDDIVDVEVKKIHSFGAVVRLPDNSQGLIHISQVSDDFVKNISEHLKVGDKLKAKIKKISADGKIDLTLKKTKKVSEPAPIKSKAFKINPFQEKIDKLLENAKLELS